MSENTPNSTDNTPAVSSPIQPDPLFIEPLSFLPPNISDLSLAQPYSASSSNPLGKIPTEAELREELEGQARMAEKVKEQEIKKASKAQNREGRRVNGGPTM